MFALIWTNFTRRKGRLVLTLLSVLIAFFLFGQLMAARQIFNPNAGDLADLQQLRTTNRASRGGPLPIAYAEKIEQIPGVKATSYMTGTAAWYQNPKKAFAMLSMPKDGLFAVFPSMVVPPEKKKNWKADRDGALVTPALMKAYGWKIGQKVPLMTRVQKADGSTTWYVTIDGVTRVPSHPDDKRQAMFIHYEYFNNGRVNNKDTAPTFITVAKDPTRMAELAKAIDSAFAHSSPQTRTMSVHALQSTAYQQLGNIGKILSEVAIAMFFSMLLVVGTIMVQIARERRCTRT